MYPPPPYYGAVPGAVPPIPQIASLGLWDQAVNFVAANAPTIVTACALGLIVGGVVYGKDLANFLVGKIQALFGGRKSRSSDDSSSESEDEDVPSPTAGSGKKGPVTRSQKKHQDKKADKLSRETQALVGALQQGVQQGVAAAFQKEREVAAAGAVQPH